jgi:Arc/MetJ-type ribon-helix-helix transcriptional regulator
MARMTRTQIMLDPRQMDVLQRESKATGKSKSELIRRAIDAVYDRDADKARRMAALQRFLTMERPPLDQIGPLDTTPGWRERLHERGPHASD